MLNSLSVVLRLGENTDLSCMGAQWLFHVSFNLAFSTLIVKVYRIYRLMTNKIIARIRIGPNVLYKWMSWIMAPDFFMLLLWTAADRSRPCC